MLGSSRPDLQPGAVAVGLWLCLLVASAAECASTAHGFVVRHADTRLSADTYVLDAGIDLKFSPESLEAMESGVPITVLVEVEVARERLFLDKRIRRIRMRHRIRKHALSGRYVVTDVASGKAHTYTSFDDMIADLGTVRGLALLARRQLEPGRRYRVRLRARLDIEALPSPLRPLAYLSSLWRLRSDWFTWVLSP